MWAGLPRPGLRAPTPERVATGPARSACVQVTALALVLAGPAVAATSLGRPAHVTADLLLLALAGALGGGVTVLVHRRAVRSRQQLARMATQAAAGQEVSLAPEEVRGDLGPLGVAVFALVGEVERQRHIVLAGAILDSSTDLTVILDERGLITHASSAATAMLGRPSAWLAGQCFAGLAHHEDRLHLEDLGTGLAGSAAREVRLSHLLGDWVVTEITACDLRGDPDVGGIVLNIRDVSARKAHEEDLVRRALYDPLTGLANRALFREHVEKALARLRRSPALPHAVLFIDLDDFKTVNDSLGHAAGDEVLVEVGSRLRRWIRPGDTAGRLGGDEFSVLLENTSQAEVTVLADRILQVLLVPVHVQGKEVVLSGSIGIALSESGKDAEALLRNADAAMYTAKGAGKGQFRMFEPEMHHAALRRLDLEADLRRAIEDDELFLVYQPICDLATREVCGMEVLVRWQHPEHGLIPPLDFIPLAEDTGLIRPLGRIILERSLRQAQDWAGRFPRTQPLRVCVNASVRQIEHPGFYNEVAIALDRSGFDGCNLTLEITESLFMNDLQATVEKLSRLKELGLKLAVDDFGTGYSSLSYLRSLPIDILKIDKSFVAGVTLGVEHSAVAQAVVKLARTFNLRTVAEGIEQPEQAARLLAIGADMGQGYLFSRPLTTPAMEAFLAESGTRERAADVDLRMSTPVAG